MTLFCVKNCNLSTLTDYFQMVCGYHLDAGLSKCIHFSNSWFEERQKFNSTCHFLCAFMCRCRTEITILKAFFTWDNLGICSLNIYM